MEKLTWVGLNSIITSSDEEECRALLADEKRGPCRAQFLLRIHSRFNRLRADRERKELRRFAIDRRKRREQKI